MATQFSLCHLLTLYVLHDQMLITCHIIKWTSSEHAGTDKVCRPYQMGNPQHPSVEPLEDTCVLTTQAWLIPKQHNNKHQARLLTVHDRISLHNISLSQPHSHNISLPQPHSHNISLPKPYSHFSKLTTG